jgi:alpha-D-ribose 1-methylphosphonate 5-triphosphate synthase subunit PhnH
MNLDFVHDVQRAYRNLLKAYAFPGTRQQLLPEGCGLNMGAGTNTTAVLLAVILLDNEVQSYLHGVDEATAKAVRELTYTRFTSAEAAHTLFFLTAGIAELRTASIGTHVDPHLGADICIQLDSLPQDAHDADGSVAVSGPGIQHTRRLSVESSAHDGWWWVETRNFLCREYPLGVETILFDDELHVMVFPRSTNIQSTEIQGGNVWPT